MRLSEEDLKRINNLSLKDDILFNIVFRNDLELSKKLIEILEDNELSSNVSLAMQHEERESFNKKTVFDMRLLDNNDCYIIEVQNNKKAFPPQRADLIITNAHSSLCTQGTKFEDYPYIKLHVICAYDNFGNDEPTQKVRQMILNNYDFVYSTRITVVYHNITSNKLPNNLYGDLCKFIYNNTLSNHKFINKLNDKIIKIKKEEKTMMKLHENLCSIYWREQAAEQVGIEKGIEKGIEQGIEQGKLESLLKFISTSYDNKIDQNNVLTSAINIFSLPEEVIIKEISKVYTKININN